MFPIINLVTITLFFIKITRRRQRNVDRILKRRKGQKTWNVYQQGSIREQNVSEGGFCDIGGQESRCFGSGCFVLMGIRDFHIFDGWEVASLSTLSGGFVWNLLSLDSRVYQFVHGLYFLLTHTRLWNRTTWIEDSDLSMAHYLYGLKTDISAVILLSVSCDVIWYLVPVI